MKLIQKSVILLSLACVSSCSSEDTPEIIPLPDITINNFPVIDGSDSTDPLRDLLMCKILGFEYKWERRPFTQEPEADIKESTAYELFEFLTTPAGQDIVNESGYVPLN